MNPNIDSSLEALVDDSLRRKGVLQYDDFDSSLEALVDDSNSSLDTSTKGYPRNVALQNEHNMEISVCDIDFSLEALVGDNNSSLNILSNETDKNGSTITKIPEDKLSKTVVYHAFVQLVKNTGTIE